MQTLIMYAMTYRLGNSTLLIFTLRSLHVIHAQGFIGVVFVCPAQSIHCLNFLPSWILDRASHTLTCTSGSGHGLVTKTSSRHI